MVHFRLAFRQLALRAVTVFILITFGLSSAAFAAGASYTDAEIRKIIIRESIASYPGNCPCPYNRASNGSRCGKRSAYSRAGGYSPLCFARDVTDSMVEDYRKRHGYK